MCIVLGFEGDDRNADIGLLYHWHDRFESITRYCFSRLIVTAQLNINWTQHQLDWPHYYSLTHPTPPHSTTNFCLRQPGARLTSAWRHDGRACALRIGLDACPSKWGQFGRRAVAGNRSSPRLTSWHSSEAFKDKTAEIKGTNDQWPRLLISLSKKYVDIGLKFSHPLQRWFRILFSLFIIHTHKIRRDPYLTCLMMLLRN